MNVALALALLQVATATPTLPPAPPASASHGPDVIVTGRRVPPIEVVRRRVRAITQRTGEQVARFAEPVCASVIGLPEPYAGRVRMRIMADARVAGAEVARPGCRANVTLVVVDDSRAMLTRIKRENGALADAMPDGVLDRALAEPAPARAITLTQMLSRDGSAPSGDQSAGNSGPLGGAPTLRVDSASIIDLPTRQDMIGSLILLDTQATFGKTLNQLADYVAMRALARTSAPAEGTDDTILTLFSNTGDPPPGLTAFDAAFLKALYHGPATMTFRMKIAQMAHEIVAGR